MLLVILGSYSVHATDVVASDNGRLSIIEENDYFASHDDRHYTQGMRLAYLSQPITPDGIWDHPYSWLSAYLPIFVGEDRQRKYEWTVVGQSIFTPTNTSSVTAPSKDRPYASWLYTGTSLLQETKHDSYHTLENAELLVGVVGPAALGALTQNDFHQFIGTRSALGWSNQLHNEIGAIVTYEKKWRFQQPLGKDFVVDAIPEVGGSAGNILTYGEVGLVLRFGQNIAVDYGVNHVRPSLSGTAWFDEKQLNGGVGWYLFAGVQGRAVGRNIFLEGNTFRSSQGVEERPLIADFSGGASVFWSSAVRADFTFTQRTDEFYGQQGHPDRFGGINLTIQL
jgi:hypothetical protein